jgi:hypothetical protein
MRVNMREDLAKSGTLIPCLHQAGAYLSSSDIESSQYIGTIEGGEDSGAILLQLSPVNGYGSLALVYSIDLEFH